MRNPQNPFLQRGGILDSHEFFGRRAELEVIRTQLDGMQSISIVGERRIGKTSLLNHIVLTTASKTIPDRQFVYTDLPNVRNEPTFYQRLCKELGRSGDGFHDLEIAIANKQVIVCLDEFERIVTHYEFSGDFYNGLRSLAQSGNLAFVVATQRSLADLCRGRQIATSPFWNIFFRFDLGLFTHEEAEEFIVSKFQRVNVVLDGEEIYQAISIAGRFPFFLQLASYHIFEMKMGRTNDWRTAFALEAYDHLLYLWQSLEKSERNALRSILGIGLRLPDHHLLHDLARRGLIVLDDSAESAALFSEAFERIVEDDPRPKPSISAWQRIIRWCKGGKVSVGTTGASGEIQFERPKDDP